MNMKKASIVFATIVAIATSVTAQKNWSVDPRHSKIKFTTTHSMITEVDGYFKVYEGQITGAKEDFTGASILFSADASSINTEDEQRDGHLKSPDFFDVEKYPKITFKSTSFKKLNSKNYKLVGDLTIKGVTKTVSFDVIYTGTVKDPSGDTRAGFKLTGNVNRYDYGLKWNMILEAGGLFVSENVAIVCNLELLIAKAK